jgi:hypothetical protein
LFKTKSTLHRKLSYAALPHQFSAGTLRYRLTPNLHAPSILMPDIEMIRLLNWSAANEKDQILSKVMNQTNFKLKSLELKP